jgi:ATP-dependent DNA helicase PIF1
MPCYDKFKLYGKQLDANKAMILGSNVFITGAAGTGKCMAHGTKLLKYDGSYVAVQHVTTDDFLMGDDSTPRKVLSTTSGMDSMYSVRTSHGDSYTVNSTHILTLIMSPVIVNNNYMFGNKDGILTSQPIEFGRPHVTVVDLPIKECSNKSTLWYKVYRQYFVSVIYDDSPVMKSDLFDAGILIGSSRKCIPFKYRTVNKKYRVELLRGIIQGLVGVPSTNGSTLLDMKCVKLRYRERMTQDIIHLTRSVGFSAMKSNDCIISIFEETLPMFFRVKPAGYDKYYGFELDGNHRYVMYNCIVTHNTAVVKDFIDSHKSIRIMGVTSTTGVSALLFGGSTLHSFLGIGLGRGDVATILKKIRSRSYLIKRWTELESLIIDEVSMLSPALFTKLSNVAKEIRFDKRPFGGIQLIVSGDFLQLPCVGSDHFCFESPAWKECFPEPENTIYLTKIMRQRNPEFQEALNNIRMGYIPQSTKDLLDSRVGVTLDSEKLGIKPTMLFPKNHQVDVINEREMDTLAEDGRDFYQYDIQVQVMSHVKNKQYIREKYMKICNAPTVIQLCVDSQVILLHNLDSTGGLVNGSRGVVVKILEDVPIVRFTNGRELAIVHHVWEHKENNKVSVKIVQIPLKLAWALTIHKSQGQSLDAVEIDISEAFEDGQGYVGLSRVREYINMTIRAIDYDKIVAHPAAVEYYKNLEDYNSDSSGQGPRVRGTTDRNVKKILGKYITEKAMGPV